MDRRYFIQMAGTVPIFGIKLATQEVKFTGIDEPVDCATWVHLGLDTRHHRSFMEQFKTAKRKVDIHLDIDGEIKEMTLAEFKAKLGF